MQSVKQVNLTWHIWSFRQFNNDLIIANLKAKLWLSLRAKVFFIKAKKPWVRQNWIVLLERHRHTGRERLQALLEILERTSTNYQELAVTKHRRNWCTLHHTGVDGTGTIYCQSSMCRGQNWTHSQIVFP